MPYAIDNIPEMMKGAPRHAVDMFIATFNTAYEKSKDDGAAMAIAMAAVHKAGYKKDDKGKWMSQSGVHSEWIPIFKAGTHTDSAGNQKTWTVQDLNDIVSKYNPSNHEAPVVIGHPEHNSPAWGWVESLKQDGQILYAKFKNLVPEFVEMVKQGLYKKKSISLYPDLTLRHVGYLGGMPPAVKGLADVAFAAGKSIEIEFNDPIKKEYKNMKMFEWLRKKANDEGVSLEDVPANYTEDAKKTDELKQKEASMEIEFTERKKTLDAEDARLKAEGERLKQAEGLRLKDEIKSFCEGLCKKEDCKITPAMLKYGMGMANFLEAITAITTSIEFTEGDKKVKQTPVEYMKSFLSAFKKQIEFSEIANNEKDSGSHGNSGAKLEALTKQKMKDNKGMSYTQAFSEVQRENIDLAMEYAGEVR